MTVMHANLWEVGREGGRRVRRRKGKRIKGREKKRRMVINLYVTPWVPRILGLKQRDEVIIMNLGRMVVHMW